jgi:hypothetical protein
MLKSIAHFEIKLGEKVYQFLCDNDAPITDVKEAIFQITKIVGQVEANIEAIKKQQEEAKQAEVPPQEEVKANEH